MAGRSQPGGILGLLELIEEHRAAIRYDWRTRFHERFDVDAVDWSEAVDLVKILRADSSSMIATAMEGWEFPITRETAAILDLFDLEHAKAAKDPRPHMGRPWSKDRPTEQHGNAGGRTPEEVKAILRERFGRPEAPV